MAQLTATGCDSSFRFRPHLFPILVLVLVLLIEFTAFDYDYE